MTDPDDAKNLIASAAIEMETRRFLRPELTIPVLPKDQSMADTMYDRLMHQIAEFEKELDPTHEVGACLAYFGKEILIHIEQLGYHNPGLVIFYGIDGDGHRVTLLQHMAQVNVLLVAVEPLNGKEPHRIGFTADADSSRDAPSNGG
jgi:hypothetical protein